jgi:hypothetical protein
MKRQFDIVGVEAHLRDGSALPLDKLWPMRPDAIWGMQRDLLIDFQGHSLSNKDVNVPLRTLLSKLNFDITPSRALARGQGHETIRKFSGRFACRVNLADVACLHAQIVRL